MNITTRASILMFLLVFGCDRQANAPKTPSPHTPDRPSPPLVFSNNTEWVKSSDGILQFRIGTDAKVYGQEDDVYVSLELQNISGSMILVEPIALHPFGSTDQLTFTGPNGKIKYMGAYKSMLPPQPEPLGAGASKIEVVYLHPFKDITALGEYSIRYRYVCYNHYNTNNCWKGDILSAFISFTKAIINQQTSAGDSATRIAPEK